MITKFYKSAKIFKRIPLNLFIHITRQRDIFPFYHLVSDENVVHIKHLYNVRSVKAFEKDLDFFLKYYSPFDFNRLIDKVKNGSPIKGEHFLLTFDDGLKEFHDIIAPILIRKGILAICFLNSDFIDNKDLFFRYKASILIERLIKAEIPKNLQKKINAWYIQKKLPVDNYKSIFSINYLNKHYLDELANLLEVDFSGYLRQNKPYMSSDQINSLIKQGFLFGAHSIDHPQFSNLQQTQQIYQTEQSIKEVSTKFNLDYKLFSFPFTDFGVTKQFFNAIFEESKQIADITFGCAGLKKDSCKNNIQRIPVEIDNFSAQEVIYGEYLYYIFKAFLNKNTIRRL